MMRSGRTAKCTFCKHSLEVNLAEHAYLGTRKGLFELAREGAGKTFSVLRGGLPQQHCYDLVYRHGQAVADDGRTLLMGSTGARPMPASAGKPCRPLCFRCTSPVSPEHLTPGPSRIVANDNPYYLVN